MPTVKKAGGDTSAEITQAFMKAANEERWSKLAYHYEDVGNFFPIWKGRYSHITQTDASYAAFEERLFIEWPDKAAKLHSNMTDEQYLDAISAPSSGKGVKKKSSHKRVVDISDQAESDTEERKPDKSEDAMDTAP